MTTRNLGRQTLALDDLICRDDINRIAAETRAELPTWLVDQYDAASAESEKAMATSARDLGGTVEYRAAPTVPAWVRLGLLEAVAAWFTGTARTCLHSPNPQHPAPVTAAAWKPGFVVCAPCTRLLCFAPGSVKDRTCDGCGHVCAGTESGDPIYPSSVGYGPLAYLIGTCEGCRITLGDPA